MVKKDSAGSKETKNKKYSLNVRMSDRLLRGLRQYCFDNNDPSRNSVIIGALEEFLEKRGYPRDENHD